MIQVVYYNENVRCYPDGRVERLFKKKGWTNVENTANDGKGYNYIEINDKKILRHRIIAFCWIGLENIVGGDANDIDHIDRNKLNNHADNLRIVTHQQNSFNTNAKGYYWREDRNKWRARIKVNGKEIYLGLFIEEADARQAYLIAKRKYHLM